MAHDDHWLNHCPMSALSNVIAEQYVCMLRADAKARASDVLEQNDFASLVPRDQHTPQPAVAQWRLLHVTQMHNYVSYLLLDIEQVSSKNDSRRT